MAEVFKQYELEAVQEEYEREKMLAMQQFEAKEMELKECLLNDLQDKKKAYDHYRHNIDLSSGGTNLCRPACLVLHLLSLKNERVRAFSVLIVALDSFEPKSMVTRKLRRRHYDPMPTVEKRRKVTPISSLVYMLEENEVEEDIKTIFKVKQVKLSVLSKCEYYCRAN